MNNKVITTIDVSRPAGRKIVRALQNKRTVTLEYSTPPEFEEQKWHTVEEVFTEVEKKLNDHYGTNLKLKY